LREELAQVVQQRTGLDEAMALQVATVAIDFLKERLPPELAPLLDGQTPNVTDLGGMLGGLFGNRSE
jgi:hypothetical protein